jgi:hypothetical protein
MEGAFRVQGREPELWYPDTGRIAPAAYGTVGERTIVAMQLAPRDMLFVVFARAAAEPARIVTAPVETTAARIEGPWQVSFQPGLGAPESITLPELEPWSASDQDGVRYFSGTATYANTVQVPRQWLAAGQRVVLDLGKVADMASVRVNGEAFGLLWKPPFRVDVTDALKSGRNALQIDITNEWNNRIAGDRTLPEGQRILGGAGGGRGGGPGGAAPNVPESGLLGPVSIVLQVQGGQP